MWTRIPSRSTRPPFQPARLQHTHALVLLGADVQQEGRYEVTFFVSDGRAMDSEVVQLTVTDTKFVSSITAVSRRYGPRVESGN